MKELTSGVRYNILGYAFRFFRGVFFLLAAWLYGAEAFGYYTIAWATVDLLIKFGALGLEQNLLFDLSYYHQVKDEVRLYKKLMVTFKATIIVAFIETICLVLYSWNFVETDIIRHCLLIFSPMIFIQAVTAILIHATMGLKNMKYRVIIRDGIESFAMVGGLFALRSVGFTGADGITLAQLLSVIAAFVLSLWAFSRMFSLKKLFHEWREPIRLKEISAYSLPMYLLDVLDAILWRVDILFLSWWGGTGPLQAQMIGVYGFLKNMARVECVPKTAFVYIFVPVTSQAFLMEKKDDLKNQLMFSYEKLLKINVILASVLLFLTPLLVKLLGKEASLIPPHWVIFLITGQLVYATFSLFSYFLVATKRFSGLMKQQLILFTVFTVLGCWLIKHYHYPSAFAFCLITYLVLGFSSLREYQRHFGVFRLRRKSFLYLCVGIVAYLVMWFLSMRLSQVPTNAYFSWASLGFSTITGTVLYFLLLQWVHQKNQRAR